MVRNETAVLKIDAFEKESITIVLSDFIGRIIQKQTALFQTSLNQIPLQLNNLPAGVYNVTAYSSNASPKRLNLLNSNQ